MSETNKKLSRREQRKVRAQARRDQRAEERENLPPHWREIHGAIWLIGLAYLFWSGNIFPGILVLVAISGVAQALILAYVKRNREAETLTQAREVQLPENCPNCGGPVSTKTVRWQSQKIATCPYCGGTIKISTPAVS